MARDLLSVKAVQNAKPREKEYLLSDGDGLFLRVLPTGKKTWQLVYTHGDRRRKMALGDSSDLGLASARERAEQERGRVVTGEDPRLARLGRERQQAEELLQLRTEAEAVRSGALKLKAMVDAWLADGVVRADGNKTLRRAFDKHVLPRLGGKPVREIGETDLRDVLRMVGRRQAKSRMAVMLLTDIRQLFRWAEKRKPWRELLVEGNPAELVGAKQVVTADYDLSNERERVLSPAEIQKLHRAFVELEADYTAAPNKRCAVRPVGQETQLAVWIMLSTCCRVGELVNARWEHIDMVAGEWLVPRQNTKTKQNEWMVFLSPFALQQFETLHALAPTSGWCFPAKNNEGSLDSKTISKQIGDRQFQFKKRSKLKNRRNDNSLVLGNEEWTPHDLRRTGSTFMQSLGIPDHVRERCLNHVVGGRLGRVYGRYDFAAEKRDAWTKLGERLERILGDSVEPPVFIGKPVRRLATVGAEPPCVDVPRLHSI